MLKVTNLSKVYEEKTVVDNITFEAVDNRIYGFLGPNGAGKSTTMNMITGYISPTKGEITVDEYSMLKNPIAAKKNIGYLPEFPPLYPDMTVYEYLDFACGIKGFKKKKDRAEEIERIMALTDIVDVEDYLLKALSKGYKQRVGLAMALIGNPKNIILDEPSSGLDPKQIVDIRNLIKKLGKDHTVIVSTHILSEAEALCDEIIIISDGKLVALNTSEDLLYKYNQTQEIELVLKGNSSRAESFIKNISDVDDYKLISEDADSCRILVTSKKDCDIREELSLACQKSGYTILELNVKSMSLEDVYLMLTRKVEE